jgi:hypothetical protein
MSKQLSKSKGKVDEEYAESSEEDEDEDDGDGDIRAVTKRAREDKDEEAGPAVQTDKDDHLVKRLSKSKVLKVRAFKGKTYVDFREYYEKDGKLLPGKKGLMLNEEEWKQVRASVAAIDKAITDSKS